MSDLIGIKGSNGRPISEGDEVSVKVKTWNGFLEIRREKIKFLIRKADYDDFFREYRELMEKYRIRQKN